MTNELQETKLKTFDYADSLGVWIDQFYQDRKARGLTTGTVGFYREKLAVFVKFCEAQAVTQIRDIDPKLLRDFLLSLEQSGHKPGGIHSFYRSVRAFLTWWGDETEPENWRNPCKKVPAPKLPDELLEPVTMEVVNALLETCEHNTFYGIRDRLIIYMLLDTGCRASELLSIVRADVDQVNGQITIRKGKGGKDRTVIIGKKSRKALRTWLKVRHDNNPRLLITDELEGISYDSLRQIILRRSQQAGLKKPPSLHSFRRCFALEMLRAGTDVFTLQKFLGHADLQVLRRYLKQTTEDLQAAHQRGSPVDRL